MTIYADTYTERGIWRSDSAYVFADNDPLTVYLGEKHAGHTLSVRGASRVRTLRLDEQGSVEIPAELIAAGCLRMHVEKYEGDKLVRTWRLDPLAIVKGDSGIISLTPWTVSVEERIADLETAIFGQSSPLFE